MAAGAVGFDHSILIPVAEGFCRSAEVAVVIAIQAFNSRRVQVSRGIEDKNVEQQLKWFADRLVAIVGGEKQYHQLCDWLGY